MSYLPIPHVCRYCLGRLMQHPLEGGGFEYFCPDCEQVAQGDHPMIACMCGYNVNGKHPYRCVKNDNVSAINPMQYMARWR